MLCSAFEHLTKLPVLGCHSQSGLLPGFESNALNGGAVAEQLRAITASGKLSDLRQAEFSNYRQAVQKVYEAINYAPA